MIVLAGFYARIAITSFCSCSNVSRGLRDTLETSSFAPVV